VGPDSAAVEERIAQYRAEMIFQAHLFPQIYAEYQAYLRRDGDPQSLLELQRERLADVLGHALRQVPAYRETGLLLDAGDPWRTLAQLPTITKADLRERLIDHCDDVIDPQRCRSVKTSGTTGEPLRIVHDFDHLRHTYALGLVRTHWTDLPLDRRVLYPFHTALDRWFEYTAPAYGLARIAEFGAVGDEAYWADVVGLVRGYRPQAIVGHPTRCLELADLLERHGGRGFAPPSLVNTWGERLGRAGADRLAGFFEAPVRDSYGMSEVGTIAVQCELSAYHVESERLWVEILDEAGAPVPRGQVGEVVITNLINRAMPLLRYRTGDLAALSEGACACGRPHLSLRLVEGREPGRLVLPGGRHLGVRAVALPLQALPLARYQVVQRAPEEIELIVDPLPGTDQELLEQARGQAQAAVAQVSDAVVRVTLRSDGAFERVGARKMQEFVSYVAGSGLDELV
jgi:phenylacetate-coenzyme A ligase PaaK-like adenylate-forming protein